MSVTLPKADAPRLLQLAALHLRDQDWHAAEAAAMLALSADDKNAQAWLTVGVARAKRSDYSDAIPAYLQALKLTPEHIGAWTDLGECYLALLRYDEATAAFRQAMLLDPKALQPAGRRARAVVSKQLAKLKKQAGKT